MLRVLVILGIGRVYIGRSIHTSKGALYVWYYARTRAPYTHNEHDNTHKHELCSYVYQDSSMYHYTHMKWHRSVIWHFALKMLHPRNPPNLETQIPWYKFKLNQNPWIANRHPALPCTANTQLSPNKTTLTQNLVILNIKSCTDIFLCCFDLEVCKEAAEFGSVFIHIFWCTLIQKLVIRNIKSCTDVWWQSHTDRALLQKRPTIWDVVWLKRPTIWKSCTDVWWCSHAQRFGDIVHIGLFCKRAL